MSKRALIVEDDANIAELLRLYLGKDGFETMIAVDGGKAVKLSADDQVVVTASRRCVRLAKIKSVSYYSTINQKFQR